MQIRKLSLNIITATLVLVFNQTAIMIAETSSPVNPEAPITILRQEGVRKPMPAPAQTYTIGQRPLLTGIITRIKETVKQALAMFLRNLIKLLESS